MTVNKPQGRGVGDWRREKKVWHETVIQESESMEWGWKGMCLWRKPSGPPTPHENGSVFEVSDPVSPSFAQLHPRWCEREQAGLTALWLFH